MTTRLLLSVGCIVILAGLIALGLAPPETGGGRVGAGWLARLWTPDADAPASAARVADARPAQLSTPVSPDDAGSTAAATTVPAAVSGKVPPAAESASVVPAAGGRDAPAADAPGTADGSTAGEVALARAALAQVGADPVAELAWSATINDQNVPAAARRQLIEDLNQDGFPDPDHVTSADLPLIASRLGLIEDLGPLAMDDVNAAAFAEAYKDLLNMYDQASKN